LLGAFDVILVLAGDPDASSEPLALLADQVASTFHRKVAPSVITTGCCHHSLDLFPGRTEAQCLRDLLISRDVPEGNIFCEEHSGDLVGRILYSQQVLLEPCSWYYPTVFCPGTEAPGLREAIERCFGDAFTVSWQPCLANFSSRHDADLREVANLADHDLTDRDSLIARAKPARARGLPRASS